MGSGHTYQDFKRGDKVLYVPKHLQPEGGSPLLSDTEYGIVFSVNTRFIGVKYMKIVETFKGNKVKVFSETVQSTYPQDLWKI